METRTLKVQLDKRNVHNYEDTLAIVQSSSTCKGCYFQENGCNTTPFCISEHRHDRIGIKWVRIN